MFRWKRAAAVAAAATLALTACSGGSGDGNGSGDAGSAGGESGGTLTWGVIVPASTFAAKDARWANESPYMQAVYDSLLKASPDGEIQPNLATEWSYNDDSTVLTLTLRDDVTFTNGETLTAEDAAASLLAFKNGTSPNASNLANVQDAKAVDATTLEITLAAPDPALLNYLTQNSGLVAPAASIEDEATATEPVGSGPYVLDTAETVVGSSYAFDKNEDYWNPDAQHYDELVLQVYSDASALLNAVQGGQVNVSNTLDVTSAPQMEAAGYTLNNQELNWAGFLLSDREGTLQPAMAELEVRQAINHALDREALMQTIGGGYGTATSQIFPTFSPAFDEELENYYEYDVDKAKQLMADAGYADGFEVTMPRAAAVPAAYFTLMADQLAQIGITVNYEDVQLSDFIGNILAGKYPMTYMQLQQDPTDWQLAQFQISEGSSWNVLHTSTPEAQELISTIQTGSEEEAEEAARELNRYVVENAWFAPFFRPTAIFVSDANTQVEVQKGNAVPYLENVQPK